MSRKNVTKPTKIIDAGDLSANITSSEINVENLDKGSIHLDWTGSTPVGVITVEARNQNTQDNTDTNPWITLDLGTPINISGNTGNHQLIFNELPFTKLRLKFAFGSGTGTLNATATMKTVGA